MISKAFLFQNKKIMTKIKLISHCIAGLVEVALTAGRMIQRYLLLHTTSSSGDITTEMEKKKKVGTSE